MGIFSPETEAAGLHHFARFEAGEEQALMHFIKCCKPELKSWLRNKKGIPKADLMQIIDEVVLGLAQYLKKQEPIKKLFGLMVEIAKNKCADYFRQRGRDAGLEKPFQKVNKQFKKATSAYKQAAAGSEHQIRVALRDYQDFKKSWDERHLDQEEILPDDLYHDEKEALVAWGSGTIPMLNEEMEERSLRGQLHRESEPEPANINVLKQGALHLAIRSLDDDLRDVIELRHYLLKEGVLSCESVADLLGYDCQETPERKATAAIGLREKGRDSDNLRWMGLVYYTQQDQAALLRAANERPKVDCVFTLVNELVCALKQFAIKPLKLGRFKIKGKQLATKTKEPNWDQICAGYECRGDWENDRDSSELRAWAWTLCLGDDRECECAYHRRLRDGYQSRPVAANANPQFIDSQKALENWCAESTKTNTPRKRETWEEVLNKVLLSNCSECGCQLFDLNQNWNLRKRMDDIREAFRLVAGRLQGWNYCSDCLPNALVECHADSGQRVDEIAPALLPEPRLTKAEKRAKVKAWKVTQRAAAKLGGEGYRVDQPHPRVPVPLSRADLIRQRQRPCPAFTITTH